MKDDIRRRVRKIEKEIESIRSELESYKTDSERLDERFRHIINYIESFKKS